MAKLSFDESNQLWTLQVTESKNPRKCAVSGCRNSKPKYGRICSRCLMCRWRANNPHQATYKRLQHDAQKRGIPFLLSLAEFREWSNETGYLDKKGRLAGDYHVDRIDSLRGYELGNIQLLTVSENCGMKARKERYVLEKLRAQGVDNELTRRYAAMLEQEEGIAHDDGDSAHRFDGHAIIELDDDTPF